MKRFSLATKMVVSTLLFFSALVPVTVYLSFDYLTDQFKGSITEQQFLLVSRMADEHDAKIASARMLLQRVAQLITPAMLADPRHAAHFLSSHVGLQTIFTNGIYLFSPAGRLIAEVGGTQGRQELDLPATDFIRQTIATKQPYLSAPYASSQDQRHPAVICTVPVLAANGELAAIFAGSIDLLQPEFLGDLMTARIGRSGYFYLTTTDRTVIVMPDRTRLLTKIPAGANRLFDQAVNGYEGCDETVSSKGLHTLAAFKRLKLAPWIMAADYPVDEAFAPVRKAEAIGWVIVIVGGMVTAFVFWRLMRRLTAPLRGITDQIRTIDTNDYARRLQAGSQDEIGDLAEAFNGLMGRLQTKERERLRSTELYQLLADHSPAWVFWMTPTGQMLYVSPACAEISGYTPEELLAKPELMADMVHPDDLPLWHDHLACNSEPVQEGQRREVVLRIVTKGGEIRWLRHRCRPVFNQTGTFVGVRGNNSDITRQQLAEESLRTQRDQAHGEKAKSEAIIAALGEAICIYDRDFRLTYQNQVHREFFGDHLGEVCHSVIQHCDSVCPGCPVALAFTNGQINTVDRSVIKEGRTFHLETTVSPLQDGKGEIVGAVELIRDVTEKRQAQDKIRMMNEELELRVSERTAQLEEANRRLSEEITARTEAQEVVSRLNLDLERRANDLVIANRELESFSYSVSHDLRAPLRHVNSFSKILMEDYGAVLDQQGIDYLQRLCNASQRMATLIDDLLNLSRVIRSDMYFRKVELSIMAREVSRELRELEPDRPVRFAIREGVTVCGDPTLLRLVMQNLIGNAWKYTSRKDETVIEFDATENGGEPVYFIRDNGVGFDMAYVDKLFGPFQRLHSASEYDGSGIGLATVQRIIHRHGGQVWAEAKVGEGATFYFTMGSESMCTCPEE